MNGNDVKRIWKGKDNKCVDCYKSIEGRATRCKSCWNKTRKGIPKIRGEKHRLWKGDLVGYAGLHKWVRKAKLKQKFCERCEEVKPHDVANISGKYKRDVNDFEWLCRKCHIKSDGRLKNLKNQRGSIDG